MTRRWSGRTSGTSCRRRQRPLWLSRSRGRSTPSAGLATLATGVGSATGDTLADAIGLLLTRKDIAAPTLPQLVRTEDPSLRDGELGSDDGNYWRVSVVVPFDFYYFG